MKSLNKKYAGPIIRPKQGAQPKVDEAELLEWWNGLGQKFETPNSGNAIQRPPSPHNTHSAGMNRETRDSGRREKAATGLD